MEARRARVLIGASGVLGAVLFGAYFGVPAFVPRLGAVLYAAHPATSQVVDIGARYQLLITFGVWLQATGSALCVVFFIGLVSLTRHRGSLPGQIVVLGSAALLALVLLEGVFTLTWSTTASESVTASARAGFDLMSRFVQVFPIVPAPAVYLPLGWILLHSPLLPRWLGATALGLGAAFLLVGLLEVFLPAAQAAAAALAAVQALWIVIAAGALMARRTTTPRSLP
jgi:hypothetical protein